MALSELTKKEMLLEIEKQKASDILLTQDLKLEAERTKAIIEQRTEIGRKLHDDLSGSLVALRFLVQDFKAKAISSPEQDKFRDIEAEISSIYKEARNYSHELSKNTAVAESKTSYDIGAYLQKLSQQFVSMDLLTLHATYSKDKVREKLNSLQTKHIYFLLKECISNTIKHSSAKNIWINIDFVDKRCSIHFTDDGGGFDTTVNEGLGLKGINESVKELGATLSLTSAKSNATICIEFEVD